MMKKFFTKNKESLTKHNYMFKSSKLATQVSVNLKGFCLAEFSIIDNLKGFCLAEFSIIDNVYNQLQLSTVRGHVIEINLSALNITNETVKIYSSAILQCIGTPAVLIIDSEDKTLTLHTVN